MASGRYLGTMSGTSMDGIDVALLEWDGERMSNPACSLFVSYEAQLRERLAEVVASAGQRGDVLLVERDLTIAHAEACKLLLSKAGLQAKDIRALGFHGHTIVHRPRERLTWQIGNAQLLCHLTGIDVVSDFRSRDVAAGGQGAPLLPLYHAALVQSAFSCGNECTAVLNIGGVANVTFVDCKDSELVITACDTGPGNALLDDWVQRTSDSRCLYDADGKLSRSGTVQEQLLEEWLNHPFFREAPPKSLDRNAFHDMVMSSAIAHLTAEDGAATLAELTVNAIAITARLHSPKPVTRWLVTGGGRHNSDLMHRLRKALSGEVLDVDTLGWNGDMLEAEGFAYLARKVLLKQPLSLPGTTGVAAPQIGGSITRAGN